MKLHNDVWIGAVICGVGVWAAWQTTGFDERSSTYPMILGGLLAALGAGVSVMGFLKTSPPIAMAAAMGIALPGGAVIAAWAGALGLGLGFLLPTLGMQIALLWLGGVRGGLRILSYALLITVVAYGLFGVALDVPLPDARVPWLV